MISFGVLGPLTVQVGEGRLVMRSPTLRRLLALQLARAGAPVPVAAISEAVWGERAQSATRSTVQVNIHRLRRFLGDDARIEHGPSGYRLVVEPGELDAQVFGDLVVRARRAQVGGGLDQAAELLDEALRLWRGPAYAGFEDLSFLSAERTRLDGQRLDALEERISIDLGLGRHADAVPRLAEAIDENPYRERLRSQLMLALYRSGRQAEALAAYRTAHAVLIEDLGIEPGRELQELHRRILRSDPDLDWTAESAGPPAAATPYVVARQLPAAPPVFVGREQFTADLVDRLSNAGRLTVTEVTGAGGTGKSALALRVAHMVADRFPDGQLYVDLHGDRVGLAPLAPREVLGRFLRALGIASERVPHDVAEASALYRSVLAERSVLVLLDNAADAAQVCPLLPAGVGCAVLVTSRRVLTDLDADRLALTAMTEAEAELLLAECAGPQRVAAEPTAARALIRSCDRLPLAIRIVGARLAGDPALTLAGLSGGLAAERDRLDPLHLDDLAVRASCWSGYQSLAGPVLGSSTPLAAFRLLGLLRVPYVTLPLAAALLDVPPADAAARLDHLVAARLVHRDGPAYRMHDLLRQFAGELADRDEPPQRRTGAMRQALACYLDAALRATNLIRPGQRLAGAGELAPDRVAGHVPLADGADATAWLDAERPTLLALARDMADAPDPLCRFTLHLSGAMRVFLPMRGYFADWDELCRLAVRVARRIGDPGTEAAALMDLGAIAQRVGDMAAARIHLDAALPVAAAAGRVTTQAAILSYLGGGYAAEGDRAGAVASFDQAIALRRQIGDDASTGVTLTNAAISCVTINAFPAAARYVDESIGLKAKDGNRHGVGVAHVVAAGVYLGQGREPDAMAAVSTGLDICREFGDRHHEWVALLVRATIHRHAGRTPDHARDARHAARICQDIGDADGEALALGQLDPTTERPHQPNLAWIAAVTGLPLRQRP